MTFISLLVALVVERFFDFSHIRIWRWYSILLQTIIEKLPQQTPAAWLAVGIVPLILFVALLHYAFLGVQYGFPLLLFKIAILLICLGPQDLWADAFACINHLEESDKEYDSAKLASAFSITESSNAEVAHQMLLNKIIEESNWRVFGVVFWFFVLGPVGAVLYRLTTIAAGSMTADVEAVPPLQGEAKRLEALLDWLPVRLLTLFFALGGQFMQVFEHWRREFKHGLENNDSILLSCGMSALGYNEDDGIPVDGTAERNALSLIDRSLVIVLVLVALLVFVF